MKVIDYQKAADILIAGGIGVLPTDTVYGLVASAYDKLAVERMYAAKNRERKPGTLIAANIDQLLTLGVSREETDKVTQWWPNPLSAVLKVDGFEYLHQGVGTLAMGVVDNTIVRELLQVTGPLITSSANLPGQPPATTIEEAIAYFGDKVDFYVDGGVIVDVQPSTIIRPTAEGVEILRQGSISL